MNKLEIALERFDNEADDRLLIRYLNNHSSDRILEDSEALGIDISYEDVMRLSAYALADLMIEQR